MILDRSTLKRYFETGDGLSNQAFVALIDSAVNRAATVAQTLVSELIVGDINVTGDVTIGEANYTQVLVASGATFAGLVTHGQGSLLATQSATVAATATSQIALLPDSSNIVGLGVNVLRGSSGAAGGTEIRFGNGVISDYFGAVTVSGVGSFRVVNVCARRLQGASGAVVAAGITASANANFVPFVEYYRTTPAAATQVSLVFVSALGSAIGNMTAVGGLAAAFDGVTDVVAAGAAAVASTRGFIGQAWNSPKRIGQVAFWDPSNDAFAQAAISAANVTLRLRGNNVNDFATSTILASVNTTQIVPTVVVTASSEIDSTNSYAYHWAEISAAVDSGSTLYMAEVQFWEYL